jgi:hypothetical protein
MRQRGCTIHQMEEQVLRVLVMEIWGLTTKHWQTDLCPPPPPGASVRIHPPPPPTPPPTTLYCWPWQQHLLTALAEVQERILHRISIQLFTYHRSWGHNTT